jgi:hypothetical protein
MSRFLRWFECLSRPDTAPAPSAGPADLRRAAQVAAEAAPRLRHAPDFEARLAEAAAVSLEYARSLADELGEPVDLARGVWDSNPLIPIIATTPEQGMAFLRSAEAVRRVLADPAARACHFLLAMQRRESTSFGYEQSGEVLHKDVLQTAVSFEDHRVLAAARTGQQVRELFVEHVLRSLAGLVPARLDQAEATRQALREVLDLANRQAGTLELQARQEAPYSEARRSLEATLAEFRKQAAELETELEALPVQPAGDEDYLLLVRDVLLHPRVHLDRERITMRVQDFGVLVREQDGTEGRRISFLEFSAGDEPAYALFFARLSRESAAQVWPELAPGSGEETKG